MLFALELLGCCSLRQPRLSRPKSLGAGIIVTQSLEVRARPLPEAIQVGPLGTLVACGLTWYAGQDSHAASPWRKFGSSC